MRRRLIRLLLLAVAGAIFHRMRQTRQEPTQRALDLRS
jgi:hypothetical protein